MERPSVLSPALEAFAARTPTLPPATHTNSYALGEREVVLVEPATPYEDEQRAWLDWARGLASQGRTLVALVATHHHVDHVGGLDVLARELGIPVWMHEATEARLGTWRSDEPVRHLVEGDTFDLAGPQGTRVRVLHTPGHAPGHVCLFDERRGALIVGDMIASVGTILIAPGDGDMAVYLEQLERLAGLGASLALPAHGAPVEDPAARFRHYVTHRLAREAKVLAAVQATVDGATAEALVPMVYADTSREIWAFAQLSLEAHLEKLVRDGKVARDDGEPPRFRSVAPAGPGRLLG